MHRKQQNPPMGVVEIDSSEDEGVDIVAAETSKKSNNANNKPSNEAQLQIKVPKLEKVAETAQLDTIYRPLESRSFWKAGAVEVGPKISTFSQGDLEHARVHPKFLHSNATSHKWAFGAIAELLDNAVDEINNGATFVKVDRIYNKRDNTPALLFLDDGGGMDPESMRKCMSLGYSSKTSNTTIGQYGNGFKTSTMRLGADVIVFSRASQSGRVTQSVGLLSYTFLRRTGQDDVIVPMIDFDISDHWADPIIYSSHDDWSANLKTILDWSPFASKEDLMLEFQDIGSHGTKIIIFNLWLNDEGIYELSFDDDDEDIRLRDEANRGSISKPTKKTLELQSHISYRLRFSLRAYTSILYMRKFTNFKIILRGKPVEQYSIKDDLKYSKVIAYRPQLAAAFKEVTVETTIGFIKEAPGLGVCGYNVYHKNRLIRPYWKVTADGNSKGYGVVGVLETNFIEPAHDKQDFERSSLFFRLEKRLKEMVMEYWRGHCHLIGHQPEGRRPPSLQSKNTSESQTKVSGGKTCPGPPTTGLSANLQQNSSSPGSGNQNRSILEAAQPTTGLSSESAQEESGRDCSRRSIEQICEENIQLFMRCEGYMEQENELKRTIEELEKELEETKMKCAKLSLHVESKKLKLLKQQQQQV
ncbi:hypothetical protein M9H77_05366 [Catharanthus roseus]|uniref:Uncharacterized protein n=1 Tax=Catharanthus roseus TaxID=4058 RepID=A0ACC0CH56_CATRO|nr:hypothetical protein M9H77_05366 [Catharanthus roseus]